MGFLIIVVVGLLVVNYFRNLDTGEAFPTATQTEQAEDESTSYTVAAGDSLWSISEKVYGSGYNWVDIRDANNIENPNDITEGQMLIIPSVEAREDGQQIAGATATAEATVTPSPTATAVASATPAATISTRPTATASSTPTASPVATATPDAEIAEGDDDTQPTINPGGTYTVERGDNLWDIAVAAYGDGFRWTDIAEANDLVNPSVIHAGNVLTIPA